MKTYLALSISILVGTSALAFSSPRPPNVVIIFTDDQGFSDVGVFGAVGFATPHLDRMAREGRRFTDFHVAQPICSASRAALLTGCYPNRIGLSGALGPRSRIGLANSETTLAEILKQKGFATACIGKWHLGDAPQFLPTNHGFDEFFGLPYSADMWPFHPEARPGTYPPLPLIEGTEPIKVGLTAEDQEQLTTRFAERAVDFIARNRDRPFFLYLAPNQPHVPLFVSSKFKGKSQRGLYGDVIMEIDWLVGEVLGALEKQCLDENTLVIFTSDNGPWLSYGNHAGSAGALREGKMTVFEGGHREPFIARWPGKIPPNSVCTEAAMSIDLLPTITKLVGAHLPDQKIDGLDIGPLFDGRVGAINPHEAYFFYYGRNELRAVRQGDWKLVLSHRSVAMQGQPAGRDGKPGKPTQIAVPRSLFNLRTDLAETHDVSSDYPEIVARLGSLAEQMRVELGDELTGVAGRGRREPGRITDFP